LKDALVAAYSEDVDRAFEAARAAGGSGGVLDVLEPLARDAGQGAAARLLEAAVGAAAAGEPPGAVCPSCGGPARMVAARARTAATLAGEVSYWRRYFHCGACSLGFAPFDRVLGLDGRMSGGLAKALALAGAQMPYRKAARLIETFAGRPVAAAATVNRAAVAQGGRAAAAIGAEEARARSGLVVPELPDPRPDKAYVVMDGTGAPMLPSEVNPDSGKDPDGRAKHREVKVGVVFTQSARDADGCPAWDPGSASYLATFAPCEEFGERLRDEAIRRGVKLVRQPVVLGDGAKWIKSLADRWWPEATCIVDWFHAAEHIHDLARLLEPVLADRAEWARDRKEELYEGDTAAIAAAVDALGLDEAAPALAKPAATQVAYFTSNHVRMQYRHFEEDMGLFIGSGAVESACNTVVAQRAKQAGMHWTVKGLTPILALRTLDLSGRLDLIWPCRQHPEPLDLAA
jgi:hypothetical protein